jgi:hypothetical protein
VPFLAAYQGAVAAVLVGRQHAGPVASSPSPRPRRVGGEVTTADLLAAQGVPVVSLERLLAETGGGR